MKEEMCLYYQLDERALPADIYLADSKCESCIYDDYYHGCQYSDKVSDMITDDSDGAF